ncbi:MAG TPA: AI-2E family transporter, partial [Candidatus Lustribacter sp.]|nr:AI-2E family transporter [Candidatus Lustribacter sp.]
DSPRRTYDTASAPAPAQSTVPRGVRVTSEWAWRLLVIGAAALAVPYALRGLSELTVPLAIAMLLSALLYPLFLWLRRRLSPGPAAGLSVLALVIVVAGLLTLVGSQFSGGLTDLTSQVSSGMVEVRDWARTTFKISDTQFDAYFDQLREAVTSSGDLKGMATKTGLTATHAIAGLFIALFATFFFLYEGSRIWAWLMRLVPSGGRTKIDTSGHLAWGQLTAFVKATIVVAAVDATGIAVGAAILRVPFAGAIFVIVFLGSFVPIVGALVSGAVAILLALVTHGPVVALIMTAVVIGVQQVEAHVLQPFLLGRAVQVHPLAVILAIAAGVIIAGIVGALIAVPTAAVLNAVGKHLLLDPTEPAPSEAEAVV